MLLRGKSKSDCGGQFIIVLEEHNLATDIIEQEDGLVIDGNKVGLEVLLP